MGPDRWSWAFNPRKKFLGASRQGCWCGCGAPRLQGMARATHFCPVGPHTCCSRDPEALSGSPPRFSLLTYTPFLCVPILEFWPLLQVSPPVLPLLLASFSTKASGASRRLGHCVPKAREEAPPQNPICHARGPGAKGPVQPLLLSISFPLSPRVTQGRVPAHQ